MKANPHETCLSASKTLKLHRKRIAKLIQIANTLPPDFLKKAKDYTNPKTLHRMSMNKLLKSGNNCLRAK